LNWPAALLDLLCPPRCLLCGAFIGSDQGHGFCASCRSALPPLPQAHCLICGRPFETTLVSVHTCGRCLEKKPAYERAGSAGLYEGLLRQAIHRFKYEGRTELARPLAALMAERLAPPFLPPAAELILPVPLHSRRLKARGYNQALLLARALFHPWRDRLRADLLRRSRWTEPQVHLKGPERRRNVRQAFSLSDPALVRGRSVMLVDDVFTTGATVQECAKVLKGAQASSVLVLTVARVK
jgi:ComF family protein